MTVQLNFERPGYEVTYDKSAVQGETVNVRAENPEDGDVSTRNDLTNDGKFVWTWPKDFDGVTHFTVRGSDGGEDTGEIDFSDVD